MTLVQILIGMVWIGLTMAAIGHALLDKREVRASIGWVGLILVFPLAGPCLYYLFGINRIRRRARGESRERLASPASARQALRRGRPSVAEWATMPPSRLAPLAYLVGRVVDRPLTGGNALEVLVNGEEAYPRMLAAIAQATESIGLSTYILDFDSVGEQFVETLIAAHGRGVEVRVLIDSVGARYSRRSVVSALRRAGVPAAYFNRALLPIRWPYFNLRTHRKILVVDGDYGFIGGMNIREGHRVTDAKHPIQDVHFAIRGPVVADLQSVMVGDWAFATRETLSGEAWFPPLSHAGDAKARVIPDGPDEDLDKIRWTLLGALANARDTVRIQTPYFLPDSDLLVALQLAALRGVQVEILLPAENNLRVVAWAAASQYEPLLHYGCRIFLGEPPFDHSKIVLVDQLWALVGSANWDPRSLRLNFEIDLEVYETKVVSRLEQLFREKRLRATAVTAEQMVARPLWRKLRDGAARLALPYL